jgi:hypothetical protein
MLSRSVTIPCADRWAPRQAIRFSAHIVAPSIDCRRQPYGRTGHPVVPASPCPLPGFPCRIPGRLPRWRHLRMSGRCLHCLTLPPPPSSTVPRQGARRSNHPPPPNKEHEDPEQPLLTPTFTESSAIPPPVSQTCSQCLQKVLECMTHSSPIYPLHTLNFEFIDVKIQNQNVGARQGF